MPRIPFLPALVLVPILSLSASLHGVEVGDVNRQANACSDFYEFANGSWRQQNPIPPGKPRWSRRIAAHDANWLREQSILDELSQRRDWPAHSTEQLLADHYAACMDVSRIEAGGLAPLLPLLTEIDAIKDAGDLQREIRHLHEVAVFVPFSVASAVDYQEPNRTVVSITAGGLGLPDRDFYLGTDSHPLEVRAAYQTHMAKMLGLSGMPPARAAEAATAIIALETRLAEASLDGATAQDPAATDHPMSLAELQALAPRVDWDRYLDDAQLPRIRLNVAEPKFMERVDRELTGTALDTWKVYFKWQLLNAAAPFLSSDFARESTRFAEQSLGVASTALTRAQRCVESTETLFPEALGKKYVERYFPPADKARALEIVKNLRAALRDAAAQAPWMRRETKGLALQKLAATQVYVGYPDAWKDYGGVQISREGFWENVSAGRRWGVQENRARAGKPTDHSLWALSPASPDAYLDLQLNVVVLPAGSLQPPYFSPNASDAVNYGAFGVGLAHDLTHFADESLGSLNDLQGRPKSWWTSKDHQDWNGRTACLVDQFEGYFIEPGVHHDGKRVLSESVADLAGVRIAYAAFLRSLKTHPVPTMDGFTPEQQFFIAWGQTSGTAMTLDAQRKLVSSDPHPVGKYRVIGPLSNSPEFARAFACKATDAMVRPAEKTCKVW
jgi:putative endopeptidase